MEQKLLNILYEYKLGYLAPKLLENGIDEVYTVKLLKSQDIAELFPKLGERLKFIKLVEDLKSSEIPELSRSMSTADTVIIENDESYQLEAVDPNIILDVKSVTSDLVVTETSSTNASVSGQASGSCSKQVSEFQKYQSKPQDRTSTEGQSRTLVFEDEDETSHNDRLDDSKEKLETSTENFSVGKRMKTRHFINEVCTEDIEKILNSSSTGKAIIAHYKDQKSLTAQHRNQIVRLIMDKIIEDSSYSLSPKVMSQIADIIVEIFPTESKSAYLLATKNGKRIIYGGKLAYRYKNQKNFLKVCARRSELENEQNKTKEAKDKTSTKELWLKFHTEPWNTVLSYWKDTSDLRVNGNASEGSIAVLVQQWPALKHELGYMLVRVIF